MPCLSVSAQRATPTLTLASPFPTIRRIGAGAWAALLTVVLPTGASAALIQISGQPLKGGQPSGQAGLPLERASDGDTPVVPFASPRGPLRLLLDTGASATLVTPAAARRLGLTTLPIGAGNLRLVGAGSGCGQLHPRRTTLPPLSLGGPSEQLRIQGAEALVMAVAGLPVGIDGVLGVPLLRRLPVWVDPLRRRLSFGATALAEAAQVEATRLQPSAASPLKPPLTLPLRWHRGVPLLSLRSPGGPVSALADTGAEGLFLTPALAAQLVANGPAEPLRLAGFCGMQTASRQSLSGLGLGSGPSPPLDAIVTDNPIFASLQVEAIAGQALWRRRPQLWRLDQTPPSVRLW